MSLAGAPVGNAGDQKQELEGRKKAGDDAVHPQSHREETGTGEAESGKGVQDADGPAPRPPQSHGEQERQQTSEQ